ncbi:pancreatic lipase-related protein 2-like isoform X2 [Littorina saxatilis]|uniref:pancreatic lipase-related protein 2-like isoform X2 n=1 Tax=Littorina saxatilis TaxID=31220 RepID=UPI0038B45A21
MDDKYITQKRHEIDLHINKTGSEGTQSSWFWNKCFDEMEPEYRCYNLRKPYKNTFFHYPKSPTKQNIQFKLFTTRNPTSPELLKARDAASVSSSNFVQNKKVAFIVHGFLGGTNGWVKTAAKELLAHVPNVIAVDWEQGAKGPNYFQAAANARVVGAQIATLIKTLGVGPANVHLIGHSLGAQVVGYAGEKFQKTKIGRITGLDPAAPLFEKFHIRVKLDKTDAAFVDIMHTDAEPLLKGGLGTVKNIGHVDFWPNGGHDMPGCSDKIVTADSEDISDIAANIRCSHELAKPYFIASINVNDFLAYPCASLDDYKAGRCTSCGSGCNQMGYKATSSPSGMFVLNTGATYPFKLR